VTSVFGDSGRTAPSAPVALTPRAAANGDSGEDSGHGLGIDLLLSLNATLGAFADGMDSDRRRRDSLLPPSNEQLFASGTASAAGTLTLDLGSVPLGRVWQIRRLIVGGVAVTTSAAGAAYAFAQGAPPTDLNLTNCVDIFSSLPQGNTYGTHQLFLTPTMHLWIVFSSATAAQQYAAAAFVEDWEDSTFRSTYSE
jgi:hypothetical protein